MGEQSERKFDIKLASKEKCTGCGACYSICPMKAISFRYEKGFKYPYIDLTRCVKCGLCQKACGLSLDDISLTKPCAIFGVIHKDKSVRDASSSGGA